MDLNNFTNDDIRLQQSKLWHTYKTNLINNLIFILVIIFITLNIQN